MRSNMAGAISKRRRRFDQQEFQELKDVLEEPKSVLDIGSCISPPQPMNLYRQKKLRGVGSSDEEVEDNEDVWAPLDLLEEAGLKSSSGCDSRSSSSVDVIMDFSVWQPEVLLSTSDDEFEMRLLEAGAGSLMVPSSDDQSWKLQNPSTGTSNSCSSSPVDDKFLEIIHSTDVFNPVLREDVLLHKIELKESLDGFWTNSTNDLPEQPKVSARLHDSQTSSQEYLELQIQHHQPQLTQPAAQESDANIGIRLVQLLLACAEAVACRDVNQAAALLGQLQLMASPHGDSMQRVTSCFVEGLTARLAGLQSLTLSGIPYKPAVAPPAARRILLPDALRDEGFRLVYEFCPYFSFGHFAANAAILEAFEGESRVHIVDLGMSNALQWPALLQGLASRPGGPPELIKITGVGSESSDKLYAAGEELSHLAKTLNLQFEFRAVCHPVESLHKGLLEVREDEVMAINSAFQLHCVVKESRRSLKSVLQSIHDLSPKILTLVEQDACHNGPFFLGRFMEALHYYSAIFDAVDSILPCDSQERLKIEQYHFAEEIKNIVACEGPDRVERHERADQWRRRMSRAGFQPKPLKFLGEVKTWLSMYYPCEGYTLVEEKGCIVLGWKGKPIVAASTWRC